MKNVNYDVAQ